MLKALGKVDKSTQQKSRYNFIPVYSTTSKVDTKHRQIIE